jgi:two-component system, cell cycle sensor histidine kinase and response regulator CckA
MRRGTWLRTARARTPRSARRPEVFCKSVPWEAPRMSATILVVDDDPVTLTLVERTLRAGGYRVWTASSAEEARQLLQDLAGAVDLVLTDIAMPGRLGTDLARQIGTTQRWVRVLLMSSYTKEDLERQGLEVPEAHLLRKPFAPARLLGRIREALAT